MLEPVYRKKFKNDLHRMIKRGKPASKIKDVIEKLLKQVPLKLILPQTYGTGLVTLPGAKNEKIFLRFSMDILKIVQIASGIT